jgi:hypothetical protein
MLIILSGRLSDHHITVVVDTTTNEITRVILDIQKHDELNKLTTGQHKTTSKREEKDYEEAFNALPDLSIEKFTNVLECFPWYFDEVMNAVARIGGGHRLLEFFAYETIGASIGSTKAMARVDFS